jgi:hypothetical protein
MSLLAAAMSIECTTSANSTVTCLYSAGVVAVATAAPHSLQNFEFGGSSVPHDPHTKAAAVISLGRPAPQSFTALSCHHRPANMCHIAAAIRDLIRSWPNLTDPTISGVHFVQEDSPDEIGAAVAQFVRKLRSA